MANSRRAGSRPWAMAIGAGSTSAAAAAPHWRRASVPAANVSILIWVLAAVLAVAGIDVWQKLARLRTDFGDADDALRMVQVRELMASGHWFDTTLARIGGPAGMLSHLV